jgi:hypothetical protein
MYIIISNIVNTNEYDIATCQDSPVTHNNGNDKQFYWITVDSCRNTAEALLWKWRCNR